MTSVKCNCKCMVWFKLPFLCHLQDMRFSSNSNTIFNIQVGGKVVEVSSQELMHSAQYHGNHDIQTLKFERRKDKCGRIIR